MITELHTYVMMAIATFYGSAHHGKYMANNERYDMHALTCATWLYPIGTKLKVSYGIDSVIVTVTDKCDDKTDIDLSYAAFKAICDPDAGRITVKVEYVEPD